MTRHPRTRSRIQWIGLAAGPLLAGLCYAQLPRQYAGGGDELIELSHAWRVTLAVMVWMALWWLTEAIEISATALLPIALLPVLGAATIGGATAPYADKLIFLFLGGFLLALAMQRWGLDRRIALAALLVVGPTVQEHDRGRHGDHGLPEHVRLQSRSDCRSSSCWGL